MSEPTVTRHIQSRPGVCGGKPCVAGTRIRVQDVMVWHELQGLTPDEIVAQFPQLTLSDVHSALAYYHDHREEIRQQMQDGEELARRMIRDNPPRVPQKLAGDGGRDDTPASG